MELLRGRQADRAGRGRAAAYPGQIRLCEGQVLLRPQRVPLQDVLVVQQQQLGRVLAGPGPAAPPAACTVRAPAPPGGLGALCSEHVGDREKDAVPAPRPRPAQSLRGGRPDEAERYCGGAAQAWPSGQLRSQQPQSVRPTLGSPGTAAG